MKINVNKWFALVIAFCVLGGKANWTHANDTIDEVLVYGRNDQNEIAEKSISVSKTMTDILRLPQSVQVLNRLVLDEQDSQNLSEALTNISGVSGITPAETLISDYKLRGFDGFVYYDQIPAFGQVPASDPESLINVERIEVVKGPSSTLFGGGTGAGTGGLINIVTKSPLFEEKAVIGVRAGSFDTVNPYFDFNQPFNDTVAFRITGNYNDSESQFDAVESNSWSLNPSLALRLSSRNEVELKAQFSELEYREYAGLPVIGTSEGASYSIPLDRFPGATNTPLSTVDDTVITGRWNSTINADMGFNLSARYYDSEFVEYSSFPSLDLTATIADTLALLGLGLPFDPTTNSTYAISNGSLPTDTEQLNINANFLFRFDLGNSQHQVLMGVELDETDNDAEILNDNFCNVFTQTFALFGDPLNPVVQNQYLAAVNAVPFLDLADSNSRVDFGPEPSVSCFGEQDYTYETLGVYAQNQIAINEQWNINVGLRWTRLESDESDEPGSVLEDRTPDNDQLTGRVGVTYAINDGVSVFAGYGQGFQAPIGVVLADQSTPEPSESESWEVGLKWRTDNGFSGNLAYFDLTRTNISTADPVNPGFRLQVGEQQSKGFELDFVWQFTPQWMLLGNFANLKAEVTEDNTLPEGDTLARIPEQSGRLSLRHEFSTLEGLALQIGASYRGKQEITLPNTFAVESYTVLDTQLSYAWSKYTARLSIQNLTDKEYFTPHGFLGLPVVQPGVERSAYLSFSAEL